LQQDRSWVSDRAIFNENSITRRSKKSCSCLSCVKRGRCAMSDPCPLYPQKQTSLSVTDMSALCQKQTSVEQDSHSACCRCSTVVQCSARLEPLDAANGLPSKMGA